MPIIPYLPEDLDAPQPLVDQVRARRGGRLLNLDRVLLRSAPFAEGWNQFMGNVRRRLALDPRLRELAMCVVAVVNRAEYEFIHHAPEYRAAGASEAQVEGLRAIGTPAFEPALYAPVERATIDLSVAMTRDVAVPAPVMAAIRAEIPDPAHLVELVGVIAAYNMVSRFLVALEITPE